MKHIPKPDDDIQAAYLAEWTIKQKECKFKRKYQRREMIIDFKMFVRSLRKCIRGIFRGSNSNQSCNSDG